MSCSFASFLEELLLQIYRLIQWVTADWNQRAERRLPLGFFVLGPLARNSVLNQSLPQQRHDLPMQLHHSLDIRLRIADTLRLVCLKISCEPEGRSQSPIILKRSDLGKFPCS